MSKSDDRAPAGAVWCCAACGRRASHRVDGGISDGWDESCFLHAVLCDEASVVLDGWRVIRAKAWSGAA